MAKSEYRKWGETVYGKSAQAHAHKIAASYFEQVCPFDKVEIRETNGGWAVFVEVDRG